MDQPPPKIVIHPPEQGLLTPPTTPDRLVYDKTALSPPELANRKQHKKWQVAEKPNDGPATPQSMPRTTGKSDQQTPEQTPHQHNQLLQQQDASPPQDVITPTPDELLQARRFERRKQMEASPAYIAEKERMRVIREREVAIQYERIAYLMRGFGDDDDDALYPSRTWQKGKEGMKFEEMFGQGRKVKPKVASAAARPRPRAFTWTNATASASASASAAYVPPPNYGHRPGEAWLARREWEVFLRRFEEKWGDPEEVGGGDGEEGGGEGDEKGVGGEGGEEVGTQRRVMN
jgi:hypothetical protein